MGDIVMDDASVADTGAVVSRILKLQRSLFLGKAVGLGTEVLTI